MSMEKIFVLVATLAICSTSLGQAFAPWGPRRDEGLQLPFRRGPLDPWVQRREPPPFVRPVRSVQEDNYPIAEDLYEDVSNDERFKRATNEQLDATNEWTEGEIIEEKDIPKGAEIIEVSKDGEFEEITEEKSPVARSKRAARVTIIRIRNKRTGKVTIIVIRRK